MNTKKKSEPTPMTLDQLQPRDLVSMFALTGLLASMGSEVVPRPGRVVDIADLVADEWIKRRAQ
jgi:hypothetical protein